MAIESVSAKLRAFGVQHTLKSHSIGNTVIITPPNLPKLVPNSLQNCSDWFNVLPTICITPNQPEWTQAYSNWLNGQNPTPSPEWKKGVYLTFSLRH